MTPRPLLAAPLPRLAIAAVVAALLAAVVPTDADPTTSAVAAPQELGPAVAGPATTAAAAGGLPRPTTRFGTAGEANVWMVRDFVRAVEAADDATRSWNGSVAGCDAGSRTTAEQEAVVDLVNAYRYASGVPALSGAHAASAAVAQEASLVMEANNALSHNPPSSWTCWSEDALDGASTSNLALGYSLWTQVTGYIEDPGANNTIVGHRQWLLSPQLDRVGVGATDRGAAIRVIDVPRSSTTTPRAIPYPPAGFSPVALLYPRWSLSFFATDVDLGQATVRVTTGGRTVATTNHGQSRGYGGLTTLSWDVTDTAPLVAAAAAGTDPTTFTVTVGGVRVGGETVSYRYEVMVVPDRFTDDDGGVFEADAIQLADSGATRGCGDGSRFCPDQTLTRGQLAAMLVRALGLGPAPRDFFGDDESSIFEDDINRLRHAGITTGCNADGTRFCPDRPVGRDEMAALFTRAFELPAAGQDYFRDDDGSIFEADINAFRRAGITLGCNPPENTRFCPGDDVTRGQIAAFFVRSDLA